jgi:hypothetical protein
MDWRKDEGLKGITEKSKDKLETFFKVERELAVTRGYIFRKLRIDQRTLKRVLDAMVRDKVIEEIKTNAYVNYRATPKLFKPNPKYRKKKQIEQSSINQ